MTRSASSRTACSTSASLYLLPERDWFAEEPSSGTPRDQARRAISSCSAPAFSSMSIVSPREERSRVSGVSRDRKSTRLNSSHSQISYAVFCLKKKKTTIYIHQYNDLD